MLIATIQQPNRPLAFTRYNAFVDTLFEGEILLAKVLSKRLGLDNVELTYRDNMTYDIYSDGLWIAELHIWFKD